MNIAMTQRDKKLLMLVSSALILIVSYQSLIMPTVQQKQELELQAEELTMQQKEWQMQINRLDELKKNIADAEEERLKVTAPYYEPMENLEVDRLLTNLALKQSLHPQSIDIQEAGPGQIEPYLWVPEEEVKEEPSAEEQLMGEDPDAEETPEAAEAPGALPEPRNMVTIGKAVMTLRGERENWMKMMDDIIKNYPSLQIVRFSVDNQEYLDGVSVASSDNITCEINILMCVK